MAGKNVNQDVELDDDEIEEAHDPKNAEQQSIASVAAADDKIKKAPARKGDKQNSEPMQKTKAGMISAAHDLMSEMTEEELSNMLDIVMGEGYEEDELDEELSPEKKKAMKLAYQVGKHGKVVPNRVMDHDVSSRDYKGDGNRGSLGGRDKAAQDHLAATKGKGTHAAFDKAAKAARSSDKSNSAGRIQLAKARDAASGETNRQGAPEKDHWAVKSQSNRAKLAGKGRRAMAGPSKKLPEDYEIDYTELNALVESEATLSEEFKAKTAVIFEAAVKSKLVEELDRLEEEYATQLDEEVATIKEDLVEKVDSYLNYVVENWMEENKLAIQTGLRAEIAEGFMNGLKDLFIENYIEVPESKVDLVDELAEQVEELEEKLNRQTAQAMEISEELEKYKREAIIREASKNLAETQVAKLKTLVDNIDFNDEQSFALKVKTIKESYFKKKTAESAITEEEEVEGDMLVETSDVMQRYIKAIKQSTK